MKLEGHKLVAINAGRTDTSHSTCLHVPSIGPIVGGDAVYNGIHPYLGETDRHSRLEWISTLDKLEGLNPLAVIAGTKYRKTPKLPASSARHGNISGTARQLYDAMLDLYPDRVNPGSLWGAANTAKRQALGGRFRATRSEDHAIDQSPSDPASHPALASTSPEL